VLLWNIALDRTGGPVQAPNSACQHCTGVVTVDDRTGTVSYGRDYYQLGQASSFIQPGGRRIGSNNFVTYNSTVLNRGPNYATAGLDDIAFANPDGSKVLLVFNNSSSRSEHFAVKSGRRSFRHTLPPQATATFVWDRPARRGDAHGGSFTEHQILLSRSGPPSILVEASEALDVLA
jgi:glucosylceramidase